MERVKKLNIVSLIVAGLIALTSVPNLLGLPILLVMGLADNPNHISFFSTLWIILFTSLVLLRGILLLLFASALYLFFLKKYTPSIVLCLLVAMSLFGLIRYDTARDSKIIADMNTQQEISGLKKQETPPGGYLIPGPNFAPNDFVEKNTYYGNGSVMVSYGRGSGLTLSSISYSEGMTVAYNDVSQVGKVYDFVHEGSSGFISRNVAGEAYTPTNGCVSYFLSWDDNGKLVQIRVMNIPISEYTPKDVENMLNNLQRVP